MNVISISDLRYSVRPHFWSRRKTLLHGVTLDVEPGELFGFLGPNGAGKTTTLKVLLGLLTPESGSALVFGESARAAHVRKRIGFMPERAYFPEHLSARELLFVHGTMAGLSGRRLGQRIDEVIEQVGLAAAARERLGGFSKGMLQRVGLGQALISEPELVILDEPMSGLDPLGRRDVRELMLSLREQGKTVFFSTHILPDVESICDRVAILAGGRVRRIARLLDLTGTALAVEIEAENVNDEALRAVAPLARASARGRAHLLVANSSAEANQVVDRLRAHGASIISLQTHGHSLEQVFVEAARPVPNTAPEGESA